MKAALPNALARTLRDFFAQQLPTARGLSPHTISSYRDSLVLLLRFTAVRQDRALVTLDVDDLTPEQIMAFLHHLETDRHNTAATRNVRLAAIHAFFRFLAAQQPTYLEQAQRVLSLPFKRTVHRAVEYLEYDEIATVLGAVDRSIADGRRDYALLATMFNTGARVQEILSVRACHVQLTKPYQVRLFGKGRKERACPLWPQTAQLLRGLCGERQLDLRSDAPLFVNHRGHPSVPFERYADDIVAHCGTETQAQQVLESIRRRLTQCRLDVHPGKTRIVYCKDDDRPRGYPQERFDSSSTV